MSRITELEREVEGLQKRIAELEEPETSGIAEFISEAEAEIVELAENILGRGLNYREAFFMGKLLGTFKTPQIKKALVSKRFARDPIRAAYAATINGAFGKPGAKVEFITKEVKYWQAPANYDPWG